jgi:putative endonuclease
MTDTRRQLGDSAEALAARYLEKKGYRVLARQFRKTFGEIDLICQDGNEVVFIEVKSRTSSEYGYPEQAVTPEKIGHILKVGESYLNKKNLQESPWRIDVVAIEYHTEPATITHIEAIDIPEQYW